MRALEKSSPKSEIALDLRLGLAETYRQQGSLRNAQMLLDHIEPSVLKPQVQDPLLPARYWRRKASLLQNLSRPDEAAQALDKSWKIVKQHFPIDSQYYVENFSRLANLLSKAKAWTVLIDLLTEARKEAPIGSPPVDKVIEEGCSQCRIAALEMMRTGKLDESRVLLERLTETDRNFENMFELWHHWIDCCYERKDTSKSGQAIIAVNKLLDRLKSLDSPAKIHAQIRARACLATIYENAGQRADACTQWEILFQLVDELGNHKTERERTYWRASQAYILACRGYSTFEQNCQESLLQLVGYSRESAELPITASSATIHCLARCGLAMIYLKKQKLQEANSILSSISPKAIAIYKKSNKRLCALHLRMSLAHLNQHNISAARRHYENSLRHFSQLPPEQKAEFQSRMDHMKQVLLKAKES